MINGTNYYKLMMLGIFQFNRFIQYNFNLFSYNNFISNLSTNFVKERLKLKFSPTLYRGFKILCSGRFSRRQRATSYWFTLGRVPLNTVTAAVDYASYSLALSNSAITIKVWIHKSKYSACKYRLKLI